MCRVCLRRPEIPDERYGRCEVCAKSGRIAYRFRLGPSRGSLAVRAGELSPRALREKLRTQLAAYSGHPAARPHLGLHEAEVLVAKDRLEAVRIASDLRDHAGEVVAALRAASERTDAAW